MYFSGEVSYLKWKDYAALDITGGGGRESVIFILSPREVAICVNKIIGKKTSIIDVHSVKLSYH